jgi:hypothetical protein
MRRFLLSLILLVSLSHADAQIILNEVYSSPKIVDGNSEFFELFNTSPTTPVDLDCYILAIYYLKKKCNGQGCNQHYDTSVVRIIDFPSVTIAAHNQTGQLAGYMVGSATGPNFTVQNAPTCASSNFVWNDLNTTGYMNNAGSLLSYESCPVTTSCPTGWKSPVTMSSTNDLFIQNTKNDVKGSNSGGFTLAVFLFKKNDATNEMEYVNGLLGGNSDGVVSDIITNLKDMPVSLRCGGTTSTVTLKWSKVTRAENVTETTGTDNADNGYIRCNDGKCGDWEKSSNPDNDCSKTTPGEHTPRYRNGAGLTDPVGLTLSTQASVCGTRVDFAVTGTQGRGSCTNQTNNKNLQAQIFPLTVYLYKDVDADNALTDADQYMNESIVLNSPSTTDFYSFFNLTDGISYLLLFKSTLGCVDKIVPITTTPITTTQKNYCGNLIEFSINSANYNTGRTDGNLNFTASIYYDANNNDRYDQGEILIGGPFTITTYNQIQSFDLPTAYENLPYVIVYSSSGCALLTKADPVPEPVTPITITTAQIYTCGDNVTGDVVTFDVLTMNPTGVTGSLPIIVELWADDNGDGNGDRLLQTKTQATVEEGSGRFDVLPKNQTLILRYRTGQGCPLEVRLLQTCAPLPINLGSFTAVRNKQKVLVKWETLTEQNNKGFFVQRNTRGLWENRAFVFSAATGGNSNELLSYSFNDDNIEKGVSQYRIQQVDIDNKVGYSPIRSVRGEGLQQRTIIYPNPSDDGKVNVVFENQGAKTITISDISGRVIRHYRSVVNTLVVEKLEAGMYTFQIIDLSSGESSVEKVIIKKR